MKPEQPSYRLAHDTVRIGIWYVVHRGNRYLHKGDSFCLTSPHFLEVDRLSCSYPHSQPECFSLEGSSDTPTHVFAGVKGDISRRRYTQLVGRLAEESRELELRKQRYLELIATDQVLRES